MAAKKITITLADRQIAEIQKLIAVQHSTSFSAFIQQAVQRALENAVEFRAMVAEAVDKSGGPLKRKERAWARRMLTARSAEPRPVRLRERDRLRRRRADCAGTK
jgi:hypothetical protein